MSGADDLVSRVAAGERAAVARMLSRVESGRPGTAEQLAELYGTPRRAHIVGVTGPPGSGKSSLVAALAQVYRQRGCRVGILAVDPTSALSGGAVLGDRIRMGQLSDDPGVFIRSMATRGALGGLARATADATIVLEAAGMEMVVIETVGTGQDEVEIATTAHSTVLVSVPGMGDAIQAIKAGVMEIADLHVVNKADHDGADRLVAELKEMLRQSRYAQPGGWRVPVCKTVATGGSGVTELAGLLSEHYDWLKSRDQLGERERVMADARVRAAALALVRARVTDPARNPRFGALVEEVARRRLTPHAAATRLIGPAGPAGKEGTV